MSTTIFQKTAHTALSILKSRKFFYGIVVLLVLQAIWMALTARYPMAFDEDFHFGIIKIYADQWSPFITSTPPDSGALGELTRTPSYLYHYLMSFPYRLSTLLTNQETIQIIILRFINIAMFTAGLFAFKALLQRLRFSAAVTHLSLLFIILIPVVPFLAGQINYDNLLFLLTPAIGLAALSCGQTMAKKGYFPAASFIALLSLGMLGSLVKYPYLPVFFAALLYVAIVVVKRGKYEKLVKKTWQSFTATKLPLRLLLAGLLLVSGALFIERYGGNVVQYKSLNPDCALVESVEHCSEYGPWARNHLIKTGNGEEYLDQTNADFPTYVLQWTVGLMHRLYFAINYDYSNYYELPLPITTAYAVGIPGLVLIAVFWRRLFKQHPAFLLALLITLIYAVSLFYVNYSDYLKYDAFLAINGRYLIPVLPFLFAAMATALSMALSKIRPVRRAANIKLALAAIVLIFTLQGGGVLTYAVRSDPDWYWPNPLAHSLGQGLKDISIPLIIGADTKQEG